MEEKDYDGVETPLLTKYVYVMHMKNGYEERKMRIEQMLGSMNINFKYMLDGDISDIDDNTINKYFVGQTMVGRYPHTSCALKHILTYKKMIDAGIDGALVLEDDICLHRNFIKYFNQSIKEMDSYAKTHADEPVIISYEDTRLRFIPHSKRKKGVVIYKGDRDRMTGAYYINNRAAKLILHYAETHKLDKPIDLTHCQLLREKRLTYFWCQPCIATQGSHSGTFKSSINFSSGAMEHLMWKLQRIYKKLLYFMR